MVSEKSGNIVQDNEMRIKGDGDTAEGQSEQSFRYLPKDESNTHFRGIEIDDDIDSSSISGASLIQPAPNSARNKVNSTSKLLKHGASNVVKESARM